MVFGVFFILFGVALLLKAIFHIDIPVFRSVVALFLIYLGVQMLLGGFCKRSCQRGAKDAAVFHSKNFKWESENGHKEYSVLFGESTVDLSEIQEKKDLEPIHVNVVFGAATVLLSRKIPFQLKANAAFGEALLPDENMVAFGTLHYENLDRKKAETSPLLIQGNVVFGSLKFRYKD